MGTQFKTPVTIYIVHHPECEEAEQLAAGLYDWFRLGYMSGDASGAGLPVFYRRRLKDDLLDPRIAFNDAQQNVVIALVDHRIVGNSKWRHALVQLAGEVKQARNSESPNGRAILVPAAMHESFYRTGPLYGDFNPVRLLGLSQSAMEATLRRAATEATARVLRAGDGKPGPPLDVFLSHAKRDGIAIAESIRDSVRSFGQLDVWYDANDLPFGAEWSSPMVRAAKEDTAAMVATVTDAYPTRPWCRREAKLARTPVRMEKPRGSRVWKVQPVVAVHRPGSNWVRGVPMLEGVPRIGWQDVSSEADTGRVVDRLVLQVMLGQVHTLVAQELDREFGDEQSCFITWVPDTWTLAALRQELGRQASSIRRIVYPGYGMTTAEIAELRPVVEAFHKNAQLLSFQEVWQ
jgi:hypothetical protein